MNAVMTGAVAGAAATLPMTWAMEVMHQALPEHERQPLPPREITERLVELLDEAQRLTDEQQLWLTVAAHIGYGSAVGMLYSPLARRLPLPPLAKGTAFGLAIWGASYLGLMPALKLTTPANRHPPRRTALMVTAHVVFGTAIAMFSDLMKPERRRRQHPAFLGGQRGSRPREQHQAGSLARRARSASAAAGESAALSKRM